MQEWAARGDQLRQAACNGQVIASNEAASYIDEAIVAAFDLWPQYEAALAAQTTTAGAAVAASPGQEPAAPPAGSSESPAATAAAGIPGPLQASDHIGPCIEAADEAALRRALRAVATQLDGLRQVARASQALGETAKSAAHDRQAAAAQAADTWCAAGRAPADLAAGAVDAYFSYLGFATAAVHIGYCVNGVAAALADGLGLTGPPPDRVAREDQPPPGQAGRG